MPLKAYSVLKLNVWVTKTFYLKIVNAAETSAASLALR
jgi:hypothetical protein